MSSRKRRARRAAAIQTHPAPAPAAPHPPSSSAEPDLAPRTAPWQLVIAIVPALLAVAIGLAYALASRRQNGSFGFPVDDAWIHLTFARNLAEHGAFSYFRDQLTTSGSTSPLYTSLLAALFLVSNNEMAISFVLGLGAMFALVFYGYQLARIELASAMNTRSNTATTAAALALALLIAAQPKLDLISVSGMETTLCIALLLAATYTYRRAKYPQLGVLLGLSVWCRPDALALWAAIACDWLVHRLMLTRSNDRHRPNAPTAGPRLWSETVQASHAPQLLENTNSVVAASPTKGSRGAQRAPAVGEGPAKNRPDSKVDSSRERGWDSPPEQLLWSWTALKPGVQSASIALAFLAAYLAFNAVLSGSLLPNSYAAKVHYYGGADRLFFLRDSVLRYFSSAELAPVAPLFLVGCAFAVADLWRRRPSMLLLPLCYSLTLVLLYLIQLPFAHRFGRYLMPILPFYLGVAGQGALRLWRLGRGYISGRPQRWTLATAIGLMFALFAAFEARYALASAAEYARWNEYHRRRHVAAGLWLREHTSPNAVIGTHDIGAIAFYSDRKVIDMMGLAAPEVIPYIGTTRFTSYLGDFLAREDVTYLAVLRNWFEVVNENPIYTAFNQPEFLDVFPFHPGQTHLVSRQVAALTEQAMALLQANRPADALRLLQLAAAPDSDSSRIELLLSMAYDALGHPLDGERHARRALDLFPDYADAHYARGLHDLKAHRYEAARARFQRCLAINPRFVPAYDGLATIADRADHDPQQAARYRQQFRQLLR